MSGLLKTILTAALGLSFAVPLYAADSQKSQANATTAATTQPYNDYDSAVKRCNRLPETQRGKCIVNIRPTDASKGSAPTTSSTTSSTDANAVKDGSARDADHTAALRECEALAGSEQQRCMDNAKDHDGRK